MATLEEETLEEETYPILLCTFDKYFWRSGLTLQVSVSRLDPFVYPATLCITFTSTEKKELSSYDPLFLDQTLVEILLRPHLDILKADIVCALDTPPASTTRLLSPIKSPIKSKTNIVFSDCQQKQYVNNNNETVKIGAANNSLDKHGVKIEQFLTSKLHCEKVVVETTETATSTSNKSSPTETATSTSNKSSAYKITLRGFASKRQPRGSIDATGSQLLDALPRLRERALTASHLSTLTSASTSPTGSEFSSKASSRYTSPRSPTGSLGLTDNWAARSQRMQESILKQFDMMRRPKENTNDSPAKTKWKKAVRKIIMSIAVQKTRDMLLRIQRNTM